jgi:hypothetical protein
MQIFTNEYQKYSGYIVITPSITTINGQTVSPRLVQREGSNDVVKDTFVISGFSGKILLKLSQIPQSNIIVSEGSNIYTEVNNENLVEAQKFYYKGKGYILIYIPDNSEHTIDVQYTGMGSLISAEDIWELQSGNLLNDIFTIPKDLIVNEDTTIKGNLFIYGTLETVDLSQTNELRVLDKYIYLNYGKTYNFNTDYGIAINDNDISKFKLNFKNDIFSIQYYNGTSYDTYFNASQSTINLNKNTSISGNLLINNGNVGIGTTSPSGKLDVNGDIIVGSYLKRNTITSKYIYIPRQTNNSDFRDVAQLRIAEYMTLGHLGSGFSPFWGTNAILDYSCNDGTGSEGNGNKFIPQYANGKGFIVSPNFDGLFRFYGIDWNGSNSRKTFPQDFTFIMGLTYDGKIGIGTANPSEKLHVVGNIGISAGTNAFIGTKDNYALSLRTNNTDRIYITNNGNVGIGTITPNSKLHITNGDVRIGEINPLNTGTFPGYGRYLYFSGGPAGNTWDSDNSDALWIARYNVAPDQTELRVNIGDNQQSEDAFVIGTSASGGIWNLFRVQTNGNVGIGTTSPTEKLDIVGNIRLSGNLLIGNGTSGDKIIIANNADTNKPQIRYNDTNKKWMYSDDGQNFNYFANINSLTWYKITVNYSQLNSSNPLLIYTMPANSILHGIKIKHYQQFNAGSGNRYKLSIGSQSNYIKYSSQFEVTTAVANDNFYLNNILATETIDTWNIYLHGKAYNSSGSEISATLTQGAVDIWLLISTTQPSST